MRIDGEKLERIRGRLIIQKGRNVTWKEIAELVGVSQNTIVNIRLGYTAGSIDTIKGILSAMRAQGLDVVEEDLLARN